MKISSRIGVAVTVTVNDVKRLAFRLPGPHIKSIGARSTGPGIITVDVQVGTLAFRAALALMHVAVGLLAPVARILHWRVHIAMVAG